MSIKSKIVLIASYAVDVEKENKRTFSKKIFLAIERLESENVKIQNNNQDEVTI